MFLRHLSSTGHKVIGLLYGFTSLFFLLVGLALVLIMRWPLAYPGQVTWIPPEFYNQLGAMHDTIMVHEGHVHDPDRRRVRRLTRRRSGPAVVSP